jgi:signal transduction histidine kinase
MRKVGQGLIGAAIQYDQPQQGEGEYACPIRLDERSIGALLIEKHNKHEMFDHFEHETVVRLATVVALALDNARNRGNLRLLSETVSALSDPRGLDETLQAIVASARKTAPDVDCITLWYRDGDDSSKLVAGPQWGKRKVANPQDRTNTRHRSVEEIMKRERPLWQSEDVRREVLRSTSFAKREGIVSVAAFPLRFGKEAYTLGALFLNYRKPHKFTTTERILFPILANASASAIRVALATDKARKEQERFAAAVDVSTAVGATLNIEDVLRSILRRLRDRFLAHDADYSISPYIMLYDKDENVLVLPPVAREFHKIDREEYQTGVRLPLAGSGITCLVARESLAVGKMVFKNVPDVQCEKDYIETNSSTRSELCFGLMREGQLLGVLALRSSKVAAFGSDDERLCELVAHQVAFALERANQVAEKRVNDYLTGAMSWAADVAHDINVDVSYIRYRASWLRDAAQDEEQKEWAIEIDQRAGELADKARDARSERTEAPILLSGFLERKVQEWHVRHSPATKIHFDWGGPTEAPVFVYPEKVWKAVRHLLRNAIEAMDYKGQINLRLQPVGCQQMELQVEDIGPDIPPAVRERLFREPYSTKSGVMGGMGLLIAKMLLENMNGSITLLSSQLGRGPVFAIRLPQAQDNAPVQRDRNQEHK